MELFSIRIRRTFQLVSTVMKFMYQMNYLCRYEEIADIEPKWMSSAILYRKYCKWCRDNNAKEENVTVFGRILSEAGYRKKRTPNGQVYGLYGTALTEKLYYEKREDLRGNYKQRIAKPVYQDGKRYAYTHEGLAACLSLSIYQVQRLFREKKLEGTYHMEKRTTVFDLDAVEKIIKQLKIRTK